MYFADLQSFIYELETRGELNRFEGIVDPILEAAAIITNVCKNRHNKQALLFEKIRGSELPLAANLFGTQKRVAMALGVLDIETIANQLRADLKEYSTLTPGQALAQVVRSRSVKCDFTAHTPVFTRDVSDKGLDIIPALQSWPGDGGRYLTLGQVITRHPDSLDQNCGMYRVQIVDRHKALLRCHPGSGGSEHIAAWHERGLDMPVVIVLGGPPVLTWCAGASLPDEVSEFELSNYLSGCHIPLVQCQETGLLVPSMAEIVIEGYIGPGEEGDEGPFGNHTGYYSPAALAPAIRVKRICTREQAVYPCTVVGPPPMENIYLAQATERVMLPLLQHEYPWLVDLHMPLEGIYHRAALVSVDAQGPTLREMSQCLRKTGLLHNSRLIILLDKDADLRDFVNIYWRVVNADDWQTSIVIDGNRLTIDARSSTQRNKILL